MTMTFPHVKLVRVVDGDTLRLDVDLGFNTWRLNEPYRLAHINAPELSTSSGIDVKAKLTDRIRDLPLSIICYGKDKYGRWLIELLAGDRNINVWLIAAGYATQTSLQQQLESE